MYKVIEYFVDLQDNEYPYNVGDTFPREGLEVSDERLEELMTDKNRRKMPLIKADLEEPTVSKTEKVKEVVIAENATTTPKKKAPARKKKTAE